MKRFMPVLTGAIALFSATAVTLDGRCATFADLKKGTYVRIIPASGTAQSIAGSTRLIEP